MKKIVLVLALLSISAGVFSQKIFFAYLQSENGKPFFVRLNDKVHSSSASGYVILSRLHDSTYTIFVGFPGENTEQKFSISIPHKDKGYLLKDFGSEGWGLFDLQTMTVQKSLNASTAIKTVPEENVSPFTEILAKASDDPSLKEKTVMPAVKKEEVVPVKEEAQPAVKDPAPKKEPVKEEETRAVDPPAEKASDPAGEKKESVPVIKEIPLADTADTEPESKPAAKKEVQPGLERISNLETSEGREQVYIDRHADGSIDTIRLVVPAGKKPVVANKPPEEEKKFLDIPVQAAADTALNDRKDEERKAAIQEAEKNPVSTTLTQTEPVKEPEMDKAVKEATTGGETDSSPAATRTSNNCGQTAEESDFIRLRRKMVSADDDDAMVMEARKGFKEKCFTVYQVRNLGNLFLTDEGKYKLFDAAYPYVSDLHNFISLKLELKDGYWVKRFEAMLK